MFCRRALQRIGPLARRALIPTSTNPPVRHMAFGVPGGSNNMMYFVLCGGGFTAALVYAYKTVSDDSARYEERVASMGSSQKEVMPDLFSAVKFLAGSPVEIAAASVGDGSLVEAIRQTEADKKDLDSTVAGLQTPEAPEATEEEIEIKEVTEEADVDKEELKPVEEVAKAEDAEALATEEVNTTKTVEEKEAISIPEEPSALTVEEVGEVDDVAPDATSDEEASDVTAVPEEGLPVVDGGGTTITADHTPEHQASLQEAAEASSQDTVEAALVVDKPQLAAASIGSSMEGMSPIEPESALEIPVKEVKHFHSCHSASAAGEEVAPPAAVGKQLNGVVEVTHEAVTGDGQTRESTVVVVIDQ